MTATGMPICAARRRFRLATSRFYAGPRRHAARRTRS
jgi:hypothetical protein